MGCGTSVPVGREDAVAKGEGAIPAAATSRDATGLPELQGVLSKKSNGAFGSWQKRFFKANNWFLLYYASDAPGEPLLAAVDLASADDVKLGLSNSRAFTVAFADGSKYELLAPSTEISTLWVRGLLARANWALDNPDVVEASRAAQAAARTGMGATDATASAWGSSTGAAGGMRATEPSSFASIDSEAKMRRAQAEMHSTTMAAQASLSAADAVRRSSMFTRSAAPVALGAGAGVGAVPAIPEAGPDDEDEDEDEDDDDDDSETEDSEPAVPARPPTIAEAMATVTAELGAQPMMEGKCEKRKSETKWQHRYLRVMAGVLAYCVNKDKAAITNAYPLGRPRGVIPLEIVSSVRAVPAGTAGAECMFVVECISAPDDDAARARIEDTCAAEAKDQPDGRTAKPPWGRAFFFRAKRAERATEWISVISAAVGWWGRCREILSASAPAASRASSRVSSRSDAAASSSSASSSSAAPTAAAAAAAMDDTPEWLRSIQSAVREMREVRASAPEGAFAPSDADGDDDGSDDRARGGEAGAAVRRAYAVLESSALGTAQGLAGEAAGAAKAVVADEDAKRADGAVGELLALRQLGPAIEAVTRAFVEAMELCKGRRAKEAAKIVVRGFDMTLAVELRPFQTGVGAVQHMSMSFDAMLNRVSALERYLELRTLATSGMRLEFHSHELSMAAQLQEQRQAFVTGVVELAKTAYKEAIARLVDQISRWDDSVAQPQPTTGRRIPERTMAPRNLATMFNLHLRQASRCRCALLQQLLLSATWEALSSFSNQVMTTLDDQYRRDPLVLLAGDGVVICRVINDCMALAKFVEDKGTEVTKALEDEGALLDRRELEAGAGDGITEQLEEEREELEGLLTDRARVVHSLLKIGYATLSILKQLIVSELTSKSHHPTAGAAAAGSARGGAAPAAAASASGGDGEEDEEDEEDARPPLPLLFGPDWEKPAKDDARPIACTISLIHEWFADLDSWLARLWMRRLTGMMLEAVVQVYCNSLFKKLQRSARSMIGLGTWTLTAARRKLILDDYNGLDKFFAKMERRFAVTEKEKAAALASAARDGAGKIDPASVEIRKAVLETDTELRRLRGILRDMAELAGSSLSSLPAVGTRAIINYSSHGVELFRYAERVFQLRDDMNRGKRTELTKQLEDICTSYGRHDAARMPVTDTSLQFNADNAVLRVLDSVFPDGLKQQQHFWARHTAPSAPVPVTRAKPVAHVITAEEAEEARSELDGEVAMDDFMASTTAAAVPAGAAAVLPTLPPGETAKSPGSVASRRRRSTRPATGLFNAFRGAKRTAAADLGGIEEDGDAAASDDDDDQHSGFRAGARAAAHSEPSGVPGRADPSPDYRGGDDAGFGTAAAPRAAPAHPPRAAAPTDMFRRPSKPQGAVAGHAAPAPGNPFAAPAPAPAPAPARSAAAAAGDETEAECNAQ